SMIRSLAQLGKTVLLTTHFMDEAQALADRIAVVAGGRIIAEGTPETLGGRDRQHTVIETTLPGGIRADQLPDFGNASVELRDRTLRIEAADGIRATHTLTDWALSTAITLGRLSVSQPSLEDIYLTLTNSHTPELAR
ncbi:MAG TPA: ABC transporter ATP-binding protein, partial [Ilumatobacteraceae bacterium]|nr:ABC transporter ATP-binding protein [Ilumatobacteraceae bacterium]